MEVKGLNETGHGNWGEAVSQVSIKERPQTGLMLSRDGGRTLLNEITRFRGRLFPSPDDIKTESPAEPIFRLISTRNALLIPSQMVTKTLLHEFSRGRNPLILLAFLLCSR